MERPLLTPVEIACFLIQEVEKRLSAGAKLILGRIPGGHHLLFSSDGRMASNEQAIRTLLCDFMTENLAEQIWERHLMECAHVDPENIVMHAYDFPPPRAPSSN